MTPPYPDETNDNTPCNECLQDPCICEISELDYYDDDEYDSDYDEEWDNDTDELDNERRNDL